MPGKYKLTYFNGRGLAEVSRLLLAQAGVAYDDVRIEKENWPALKPTTPFGQVPLLEVDGKVISQSRAIARFIAREHGLAGKNNVEAALADGIVDAVYDLFNLLSAWRQEQDPAKKDAIKSKFLNETLPPALANLTKILKSNGGKYFVGSDLTWADVAVAHYLGGLTLVEPTGLDKAPELKEHSERILSLPKIKEWINKRPVTEF